MPLSKKELNKIEESHQTRPYLVVDKDNFYIYAYQSSSKQWNRLNNCQEYLINKLHYHQNKDSFINLTQIYKIPFINLKDKSITLNQLDLKNIQKRLIEFDEKRLSNAPKKVILKDNDLPYEKGTVFKSGKHKIAYLFKYKNVHYGVDLLMYKIKPRVFPIYHLDKKQVLEVLPSEDFIKIVEVLSSNNVRPLNEINKLYDELREIVYS